MGYTKEQEDEFREKAEAVIKWLCDNCHPHVTVVITPTSAELSEGAIAFQCHDHVRD